MNPADRAEFEEVFGTEALRKRRKKQKTSDRYAESWARRQGGTLPDMRAGNRTGKSFPVSPTDREDDRRGADDGLSDLDRNGPDAPQRRTSSWGGQWDHKMPVNNRSGKPQRYQVTRQRSEFIEYWQRVEEARQAHREAAANRDPEPTGLRLPLETANTPSRLLDVAGQVRLYALQTQLRLRPKPENVDVDRGPDSYWYKEGTRRYRWEEPAEPDEGGVAEELSLPHSDRDEDAYERLADGVRELSDAEDVEQWRMFLSTDEFRALDDELQREDERRRDEREASHRRAAAERAARMSEPRQRWVSATEFFGGAPPARDDEGAAQVDLCAHCHIDPEQTRRDHLCRWCKDSKKRNKGALPSEKAIARRRMNKG